MTISQLFLESGVWLLLYIFGAAKIEIVCCIIQFFTLAGKVNYIKTVRTNFQRLTIKVQYVAE